MPWMVFGGAEALTLNIAGALSKKYNITFMTWLKSDHPWEERFAKISKRIYHLDMLYDFPDQMDEFVINYIKTRNIDLVHFIHTDFMFGRLERIKELKDAPKTILTLFNDRVPEYFQGSVRESKNIDVYTSDNLATVNHLSRDLPATKDVSYIPNGIDTVNTFNNVLYDGDALRNDLGINKGDVVVSFIGRLSPEKNPDTFVSAAAKIVQEHQNVHFLIIGSGGMTEQITRQVERIKSPRIHLLGYKSNTAQYLNISDIFVLPSSTEGFPLSILEAMAMGVVPIGADVGAVKDIITDGVDGIVIENGRSDSIRRAVVRLLREPALRKKMHDRAYMTARERFTLNLLSERYDNLYRKVLK
jgi:glycosyltransferase involved in cell wall biosynthesis